jgi:O-antigen/teichoic acid export membrane protein
MGQSQKSEISAWEPSRSARNVLSNWVALGIVIVVGFFLSPFLVHRLGNSAYGMWMLVGSMAGYLQMLDLGVRSSLTHYVTGFHSKQEHAGASRAASSALVIFMGLGIIAVSAALAAAAHASKWFQIPEADQLTFAIVVSLAGLNVALVLIRGVYGGLLSSLQQFVLNNTIDIAATLLFAASAVAIVLAGGGIIALASLQLLVTGASGTAYLVSCSKVYPKLRVSVGLCDRQSLRMIFQFSVYAFLMNICRQIIFYTDALVIGAFISVQAVTFYAIGSNLVNYARSVTSGISTTMPSKARALQAIGDMDSVKRALLNGVRFGSLTIFPIALTFLLRGRSFIELWMGPSYARLSGDVLSILSLALLFGASSQVVNSTFIGLGMRRSLVPAAIAEALANLGMSIGLIRYFGIQGVAWGTTIPHLMVTFLFWPLYVSRTLKVCIWQYFQTAWLRPGIAAMPFVIASWGIERMWPAPNLYIFFLQVGLTLPLLLPGYWYLCFTRAERLYYWEISLVPALKRLKQ